MKSKINIALAICAMAITSLVISHLVMIEEFVDLKTNKVFPKIYQKEFDLSIKIEEEYDKKLKGVVWFSQIKSPSTILDLFVTVDSLSLIGIDAYSGMQNWKHEYYTNFASIPDSSKHLSIKQNPYCAFDHIFMLDTINKGSFEIVIKLSVTQNDTIKHIEQKIVFEKVNKIGLKAWGHEDLFFFLIPIFGFFTLILLLFSIIYSWLSE